MSKGNRGSKTLKRCIALVLSLVMTVSLVNADVIVGMADDKHPAVHQHTFACYDDYWTTCGMDNESGHVHSLDCYATFGEPVCMLEEGEPDPHTHNHDGFVCDIVDTVLVCGLEEHTHSAECYNGSDPNAATPATGQNGADKAPVDLGDLNERAQETAEYVMQEYLDALDSEETLQNIDEGDKPNTGVWSEEHGHYHDEDGHELEQSLPAHELNLGSTSILSTTTTVNAPSCGKQEHHHTDSCYQTIYKCRYQEDGIMLLGGSSVYTANLVWNINDSTMIPRDSTKKFVTWKNDISTTISAIATVEFRANQTLAAGSVNIKIPYSLYKGRNGSNEGILDQDSLRKVLVKTGLGVTSSNGSTVTISNTQNIPASTFITFDFVYKINVLNTKDKTEFNSLKAEFDVNGDIREYSLGGQIDSGINSFGGTPYNDSQYYMNQKGRHYYYSSYLNQAYGLTESEFSSWESRGYILIEHGLTISTPIKNQPATFSFAIAPSNQGKLVKLGGSYSGYAVSESNEGTGYVYRVNTGADTSGGQSITMLIAYPKNAAQSPSDANQASVNCATTLTLAGVDGQDTKSVTVRNYHSSLLNKGEYHGSKFGLGHVLRIPYPDGGLQMLAGGKDVHLTTSTVHFADWRTEFNSSNIAWHTVDTFSDKLYLSTTGNQVYELGAGDLSIETLTFQYNGDGDPMMLPASGGIGYALVGVVDNAAAQRSKGGAYEVYVLTPESPNQWVYDGKINYMPNYQSEVYEIKHDKAFAYKVSFNKACYFSTLSVIADVAIHGSSANVKNIASTAVRNGATSLDIGSWGGIAAHLNSAGSRSQEFFVLGEQITGDTVPMIHAWDARFWNQYGFNTSANQYPFRIGSKETVRTVTIDSTMRESVGLKKDNGQVAYGDDAKGTAATTLRIDLDGGFVLHSNLTNDAASELLTSFKGGGNAFDALTVNFYTLLPKGFEFADSGATSPHAVSDKAPSGFGSLTAAGTSYIYANKGDTVGGSANQPVVTSQVTRNYRGTGQAMVKTSVRFSESLFSYYYANSGGIYNWYGSVFPAWLEANYIIGSAPAGTYYVYTAIEFLDGAGYPYDLSSLTRTNTFVDNGSVFAGTNVQSIFSGVGSPKRPGYTNVPTIMGVRSSVTTATSSTVTGGHILASTDSSPGFAEERLAELGDSYTYRMTFSDQEGQTDGVVLFTNLDGGSADHMSEWQGTPTGVDLSYCEDMGMKPRVFVNRNYFSRDNYLSSTGKPTGVTASDLINGYDNWVEVDYKTFAQWEEVKALAVYIDDNDSSTSNGYVFNAQSGFAVVDVSMEQPDSGIALGKLQSTYTELLIHANHRTTGKNATTLANEASVKLDTEYHCSLNEYVAGPGWNSEWAGMYTSTTTYPGDDYAYRLNFYVDKGKLTDIVLYDNIENELDAQWHGTLQGLARITSNGVVFPFDEGAKLYVNANNIDKDKYLANNYGPDYLNDSSNGWVLVQNPATYDKWAQVKSIAVYLGSEVYPKGTQISLALKMLAPQSGFSVTSASYTADSAFATVRLVGAKERGSLTSGKVSAKVDLTEIAGIFKKVDAQHYGLDGIGESGYTETGTPETAGPGLPYTYRINGTKETSGVLGDWIIVDDLAAGTFSGSTFESISAGWVKTDETDMDLEDSARMWVYVGDKSTTDSAFWSGVTKASLSQGLEGWYLLRNGETVSAAYKAKVKAIAVASEGSLATDDGCFAVDITVKAPTSGFTKDKTTSAHNKASVIFSTAKGTDTFTADSNTTKVDITPEGKMGIDLTITPRGLEGNWGEASGYSANVYVGHEYVYTSAAEFEGVVYNPMVYGTIEKDGAWEGVLTGTSATASNVYDVNTDAAVTPVLYLSKSKDAVIFDGLTPLQLNSGIAKGWVRADEVPEEELEQYHSWVAVCYNGRAAQASSMVIRLTMTAPRYDLNEATQNTASGSFTVLGTDTVETVKGRTVYAVPSQVNISLEKTTVREVGGQEVDVSVGTVDEDGTSTSSGLDDFSYQITLTPVFETAHEYGWLKDIFVEDRLRDMPNSSTLITETVTGVTVEGIPDEVPITAFVNESNYGIVSVIQGEATVDKLTSAGFKAVARAEFDTYDWSAAKHVVFYFGTGDAPFEYEVTDATPWTIALAIHREYNDATDEDTGDLNAAYKVSNKATASAHGPKDLTTEDTTEYSIRLPHPATDKLVRNLNYEEGFNEFTVVDAGDDYEYQLTYRNTGAEGATDIILVDSLEAMGDSNIHGTLTGVNVGAFIEAGIPVSVYYNNERLTEEQTVSITPETLTTADWTVATLDASGQATGDSSAYKTVAIWLGDTTNGSWVEDGGEASKNGINAFITLTASDLYKESEQEGVINDVYLSRNRAYTNYAIGSLRSSVQGSVAGTNYHHRDPDELESTFDKTVISTMGGGENSHSTSTPLGGEYEYNLDYEIRKGAANVAIGDTIEGTAGESGWHGTLTGIDISSITGAGYKPEVWASTDAIEDWGEVFGDPVTIPTVDPNNYSVIIADTYSIIQSWPELFSSTPKAARGIESSVGYYGDGRTICPGVSGNPAEICIGCVPYLPYYVFVNGNPGEEYSFTTPANTVLYDVDGNLIQSGSGTIRGTLESNQAEYIAVLKYTGVLTVGSMNVTGSITVNGATISDSCSVTVADHDYGSDGLCKYCGAVQPVVAPKVISATTSTSQTACNTSSQQNFTYIYTLTLSGTPNQTYTLSVPAGGVVSAIGTTTSLTSTPLSVTMNASGTAKVYAMVPIALRRAGTAGTTYTGTFSWTGALKAAWSGQSATNLTFTSTSGSYVVKYADHTWTKTSTQHKCSRCGTTASHTWSKTSTQHKCSVCGYAASHTYTSTTTQHKCSVCSYAANHSFTNYNSTQHRCSVCSKLVNHTWSGISETGGHKCTGCNTTQAHTWSSSGGYHTCTTCNWKGYCRYYCANVASTGGTLEKFAAEYMLSYLKHSNYDLTKRLDVCSVCNTKCTHDWTYTHNGIDLPFQICKHCGLPGTDMGTTSSSQGIQNLSGSTAHMYFDINQKYIRSGTYNLRAAYYTRLDVNTGTYTSTNSTSIIVGSNNTLSVTTTSSNATKHVGFSLSSPRSFVAGDHYVFGIVYNGAQFDLMSYVCLGTSALGYLQFREIPVIYPSGWGYGQLGVNLNATRSASLMPLTDDELPQAGLTIIDDELPYAAPETDRTIEVVDAWAGHDLSRFEQVPNNQLDTYDWSKVKSIAIRFTRDDSYWGSEDYFPLDASNNNANHITVKLEMKAPMDASGTTGDIAYNRAVFWELSGHDFSHKATASPLTTNRLLGWSEMPNTGGSGLTPIYYGAGVVMITLGAWLTLYKRKRAMCREARRHGEPRDF